MLFIFHSSTILLSINLGIIAIGLSFSRVGGYNIIAASAPEQYSGVAYGMTVLLFYIGMAIGPAIAGLYMQSHQISVSTIAGLSSYPSAESYNLIFLTVGNFIDFYRISIVFKEKRQCPKRGTSEKLENKKVKIIMTLILLP